MWFSTSRAVDKNLHSFTCISVSVDLHFNRYTEVDCTYTIVRKTLHRLHFTVTLAGLKNIVRYNEDFVI